jgi:hypothetical protein
MLRLSSTSPVDWHHEYVVLPRCCLLLPEPVPEQRLLHHWLGAQGGHHVRSPRVLQAGPRSGQRTRFGSTRGLTSLACPPCVQLIGTTSTWFFLDVAFYSQNLFQSNVFSIIGWVPKAATLTALDESYRLARAQVGTCIPAEFQTLCLYSIGSFLLAIQSASPGERIESSVRDTLQETPREIFLRWSDPLFVR